MEIIALKTFLAVIEEGGIQPASRKLHTVQSNITTRIKRLEKELGKSLFFRRGRRLQLAPAGQVLQDYAEQMVNLEKQTQNAINQVGNLNGELRIGSMETFAAVHLPRVLNGIKNEHPDLKLRVETLPTCQLIEQVRTRHLDCAFVGGPVSLPDLESTLVLDEELVLVSSSMDMINSLPLIVFREGCSYRARALRWKQECGHPNVEIMQMGTLDGILGCVSVGLGYTLIPRRVVEQSGYAHQLQVQAMPGNLAHVPTELIYPRHSPLETALSALRIAIKALPSS